MAEKKYKLVPFSDCPIRAICPICGDEWHRSKKADSEVKCPRCGNMFMLDIDGGEIYITPINPDGMMRILEESEESNIYKAKAIRAKKRKLAYRQEPAELALNA